METLTFTETRKSKVLPDNTWTTEITVSREPATLSKYRMERARWYDYVGDHITACNKVTMTRVTSYPSGHTDEVTETYFEVVTPTGKGKVTDFQGGSELEAFIPNSGKALITGCWKKYGKYRGHSVGYMRANKLNVDSRSKVEHTCPAKIYAIASGKGWG
jgi:hypothetical protein